VCLHTEKHLVIAEYGGGYNYDSTSTRLQFDGYNDRATTYVATVCTAAEE